MVGMTVLLLAVDIALAISSYYFARLPWWQDAEMVPLRVALPVFCLVMVIHSLVGLPLFREGQVYIYTYFGVIPGLAYGRILTYALSRTIVNYFWGMRTARPQTSDFSKARTFVKQGEAGSALIMYRRYFEEWPEDPRPLFEAADLLAKKERYQEAADQLKEIAVLFETNDGFWVQAAFRRAEILQNYLKDRDTARYLLTLILQRLPDSKEAQFARDQLALLTQAAQAAPPAEHRHDFSEAHILAGQGRADAAIRCYRRYFENRPQDPAPLFEIVDLLLEGVRNKAAAEVLREIMGLFPRDDAVWARATLRLAELLGGPLQDRKTAELLLKEVMHRVPDAHEARLAERRLKRLTSLRPDPYKVDW